MSLCCLSSFRERPFPVRAAVRLRSVRGAAVSAGGIVAACPASGDRVERTPLRGVIFPDEASQPPSRPDAARVFAVGSVSAQLPRLGFALSSRMKGIRIVIPDETSQPPSRPDAARVFAVGSVSAQLPQLGFALSSRMKLRSCHLAPVPHDPPCAQHRRGAAFGIPGLSEAVFGSGRRVSTFPVACAVSPLSGAGARQAGSSASGQDRLRFGNEACIVCLLPAKHAVMLCGAAGANAGAGRKERTCRRRICRRFRRCGRGARAVRRF